MNLTSVYVDGFNLFYGALRGSPKKWLDLRRYVTTSFPRTPSTASATSPLKSVPDQMTPSFPFARTPTRAL
jgi:hypothetical protein